ncbi:hypothetical protein HWV62_25963 [Athelia sp. TMB]|nr:hypothetical protein HWV62_25963 [Athelia sp. TMB]
MRPQTPQRTCHRDPDIRSVQITDDTSNVTIHITIPAQVAQEVDVSFQMTPRRHAQNPVPVPSPLPFNLPELATLNIAEHEDHINSPSRQQRQLSLHNLPLFTPLNLKRQEYCGSPGHCSRSRAPPSPPPSPIHLLPPSPTGTFGSGSLLYQALPLPRCRAVAGSRSDLPVSAKYLACLRPLAGVPNFEAEILLYMQGIGDWCILGKMV